MVFICTCMVYITNAPQMSQRLRLTSSISNMSVPKVEPSPLARRVGLKIVVNNLCLSKNCTPGNR